MCFPIAFGSGYLSLFAVDSKPYGITYAEWTAKWWTWVYSLSTSLNPANDDTGKNCAQNQSGPVWFLAGAINGNSKRSCDIPAGKAILFPIINSECSYAEYPEAKTESDLRNCAVAQQNKVKSIQVIVDGVPLQDLKKYRVLSSSFTITLPKDNILGRPSGVTQAISDGNWVFLKPLSPGKHEIHFSGVSVDYTTTGTQNFAQDVLYNITVGP
jgi:hypothetical protein